MASWRGGRLALWLQKRLRKRWQAHAQAIPKMSLGKLRALRKQAFMLRRVLDRVIADADCRLAGPPPEECVIHSPLGADWVMRPALWCGPIDLPPLVGAPTNTPLGPGVTLFHNARQNEATLRQIRNDCGRAHAAFGLSLDAFEFDGSYVSFALNCPQDIAHGLEPRHLIELQVLVEAEAPAPIYARLNLQYGPNTEQVTQQLTLKENTKVSETTFDLLYYKFKGNQVEHFWVDLIFQGVAMNNILLRDVTLSRRPRAQL